MIASVMMCTCDICGVSEKAERVTAGYNEVDYDIPDGWGRSKANDKVHLCPACCAAIKGRRKTYERPDKEREDSTCDWWPESV